MLLFTHLNTDSTYSVKNTDTNSTVHLTEQQLLESKTQILGVFRNPDGSVRCNPDGSLDLHEVQPQEVSEGLNRVIDLITLPVYKTFAKCCQRIIPEYFFHEAASSSGKYHPVCNLGEGGLLRHTIFVCENLNNITFLESSHQLFKLTPADIDRMLIACMMHDFLKQGWTHNIADFSQHPNRAAYAIRGMVGFLPPQDLEFIARCIETHMGQWDKDREGNKVTRRPENVYEWLVHLADYMASRNNISMEFEGLDVQALKKERTYAKLDKDTLQQVKVVRDLCSTNKMRFPQELLPHFNIQGDMQKLIGVWGTVLKEGTASDNQMKYVNLAKRLYRER